MEEAFGCVQRRYILEGHLEIGRDNVPQDGRDDSGIEALARQVRHTSPHWTVICQADSADLGTVRDHGFGRNDLNVGPRGGGKLHWRETAPPRTWGMR